MKEVVIISGKGGTGKTSITAAFATLAASRMRTVMADADVDAADLHLILKPDIVRREEFISGRIAHINDDACIRCGKCAGLCRFDAIDRRNDGSYRIAGDCEGCGVCVRFCPVQAIAFDDRRCGEWYVSRTRFGSMVHAALDPQAENSGKLVTLVRREAKRIAGEEGAGLILVDGSPGIGCPVIASITGASAVVAVVEPTVSGYHDLERVIALCAHFRVPLSLCVNKWDINPDQTDSIERLCASREVALLGRVSWSRTVTSAMIAEQSVIEYGMSPVADEITTVWERLCQRISLNQ